jgi:hypothetical protein
VFSGGQSLPQLQLTLRGIKKVKGISTSPRQPVTVNLLSSLVSLLNQGLYGYYVDRLLKAAFLVAFFGFLRCGEFTTLTDKFDPAVNLTLSDISVSDCSGMVINLSSSKTDPFRKGIKIKLFPIPGILCPVKATSNYLQCRLGLNSDPSSPFFLMPSLVPLTRREFTTLFQGALQGVGEYHSQLKPHSFRIGAATAAARANMPEHLIKTLGRWTSDAYLRYIRTPPAMLAQAQRDMANSGVHNNQCNK